jgi:hypothetical protein
MVPEENKEQSRVNPGALFSTLPVEGQNVGVDEAKGDGETAEKVEEVTAPVAGVEAPVMEMREVGEGAKQMEGKEVDKTALRGKLKGMLGGGDREKLLARKLREDKGEGELPPVVVEMGKSVVSGEQREVLGEDVPEEGAEVSKAEDTQAFTLDIPVPDEMPVMERKQEENVNQEVKTDENKTEMQIDVGLEQKLPEEERPQKYDVVVIDDQDGKSKIGEEVGGQLPVAEVVGKDEQQEKEIGVVDNKETWMQEMDSGRIAYRTLDECLNVILRLQKTQERLDKSRNLVKFETQRMAA